MSINKLFKRLYKYFSLSEKKRRKKRSEVEDILLQLEIKEKNVKELIKKSSNQYEKEFFEIELETIKKLIKKTRKLLPK